MAFSQFLSDLQCEMGHHVFLYEVKVHVNEHLDGMLSPAHFILFLEAACGWHLPIGITDRLNAIYYEDLITVAETMDLIDVQEERLKGRNAKLFFDMIVMDNCCLCFVDKMM